MSNSQELLFVVLATVFNFAVFILLVLLYLCHRNNRDAILALSKAFSGIQWEVSEINRKVERATEGAE